MGGTTSGDVNGDVTPIDVDVDSRSSVTVDPPGLETGGDGGAVVVAGIIVGGRLTRDVPVTHPTDPPTDAELRSMISPKTKVPADLIEYAMKRIIAVRDIGGFQGPSPKGITVPGFPPLVLKNPTGHVSRGGANQRLTPEQREIRRLKEEPLLKLGVLLPLEGDLADHPGLSVHPVRIVREGFQPDGTPKNRLVTDMSAHNQYIDYMRTVLPNMVEATYQHRGSIIFSKADHMSGFLGVLLEILSRLQCGVRLWDGRLAVYTRLPMGLNVSSGVYQDMHQRLISLLTHDDTQPVVPFIDDTSTSTRPKEKEDDYYAFKRHIDRFLDYLELAVKHGVRFAWRKMVLFAPTLEWLGIVTDGKSIWADPSRFSVFNEILPFRGEDLRISINNFLGLCTWHGKPYLLRESLPTLYRRHTSFIRALLKETKLSKALWTAEHERSAQWLVRNIMDNHTIAIPDYNRPLHLLADACTEGNGYAFVQFDPVTGMAGYVAADGHTFTGAQLGWFVGLKEASTLIMALRKHGKLVRMHPVVYVHLDHSALMGITHTEQPMLYRWAVEMSSFTNLVLWLVKGPTHVAADALSRSLLPRENTTPFPLITDPVRMRARPVVAAVAALISPYEEGAVNELAVVVASLSVSGDVSAAYRPTRSRWLERVIASQLAAGEGFAAGAQSGRQGATRTVYEGRPILMRGARSVLPATDIDICTEAVAIAHEVAAHKGSDETARRLADFAVFAGSAKLVDSYVKSCVVCQRYQHARTPPHQLPVVIRQQLPLSEMQVDFMDTGGLGARLSIVTAICVVSGYCRAFVVDGDTADNAVKVLSMLKGAYSVLSQVACDNGPAFVAGEFRLANERLGLQPPHYGRPHTSRNQGKVERLHDSLRLALGKLSGGDISLAAAAVDRVVEAQNKALYSPTACTPEEYVFGGKGRFPLSWETEEGELPTRSTVMATRALGDAAAAGAALQSASAYNRRHAATSSMLFQPGDVVTKLVHSRSTKLHPRWEGMFTVEQADPTKGYSIRVMMPGEAGKTILGDANWVTQEHLARFDNGRTTTAAEAVVYLGGEQKLAGRAFVSSVINHRALTGAQAALRKLKEGDYLFLVRWVDQTESWEPVMDIHGKEAFSSYVSSRPAIAAHCEEQLVRERKLGWATVSGAASGEPQAKRAKPAEPVIPTAGARKLNAARGEEDARVAWLWNKYGSTTGTKRNNVLAEVRAMLQYQIDASDNVLVAEMASARLRNVNLFVEQQAAALAAGRQSRQGNQQQLSFEEVMEGPAKAAREAVFAAALPTKIGLKEL